jgi:hypothetical protein
MRKRTHCAACGVEYPADAWRDLTRVCTLLRADVDKHVVAWPEGWVVEVRVCRACGQAMARTTTEPALDAVG